MIQLLFAGAPGSREAYKAALTHAAEQAALPVSLHLDPVDIAPEEVDYLIFEGSGPVQDFTPFTRLRAVLSLWAGVEAVLRCDPEPDLTVVRMIESGLTEGMRDYVVGHVLRHHLNIDRYIGAEPIAAWEKDAPPLARHRSVGVLGLGALGADCATHLARHGFRTLGWARSAKRIPGVTCLHGPDGLDEMLRQAEILVILLPHTAETERLVNEARIALLPPGACIVNAARGPILQHDAVLSALDSGQLSHVTMDVFDIEPMPADNPYWAHPKVTVTPHIASVTRPATAAEAIIANILRDQAGEAMIGIVQRKLGY
ncbi:MAG: glyoxylate/hydroxypyruvate reductase A [Pseudomonadota bacterium]